MANLHAIRNIANNAEGSNSWLMQGYDNRRIASEVMMGLATMEAIAATLAFATTLLVSPIAAQSIRGTVKDRDTGAAIIDASVVLMDENGRIQRGTLAEENGSFFVAAPAEGSYVVRIGAAGYVTFDTPSLQLREERTQLLDIVLIPDPSFSGPPRAFIERMELGLGEFITPRDIGEQSNARFTDLLQLSPAITVVSMTASPESNTSAGALALAPVLTRRNATDASRKLLETESGGVTNLVTVRIKTDPELRQRNLGAVEQRGQTDDCEPVLWVNGIWWGGIDTASPTGPDGAFDPADIVGIEIYDRASDLPAEFDSGLDALCGVVVVWTKKNEE